MEDKLYTSKFSDGASWFFTQSDQLMVNFSRDLPVGNSFKELLSDSGQQPFHIKTASQEIGPLCDSYTQSLNFLQPIPCLKLLIKN